MGGDYYAREMSDPSAGGGGGGTYSAAADAVFSGKSKADPATHPLDRIIECKNKNPVVVAIDVTGSMGDFPRIIFDKLPMFFGQIMMQGYLPDPAISFCAIGDLDYDKAPLQVTDFAVGAAIDGEVSKLWIEGNGGDAPESYEYAALYYGYRCKLAADSQKGFLFITGDELPKTIKPEQCKALLGFESERQLTNEEVFARCREKFHVFYLCKCNDVVSQTVKEAWAPLVGEERILPLKTAKAVIDAMLGCIAVVSGARTFDAYVNDMKLRGQTDERIQEISKAMHMMSSGGSKPTCCMQ